MFASPRQATRPDAARAREPRHSPKTLDPVHPNEGIRTAYQRKLESMIDDLHASLIWWLRSAYRANTPEMAADASPAVELQATMRKLSRRWQRNFDRGAPELAAWFSQNAAARSDAAMQVALKRAGFSVSFKLTAPANDVLQATTFENVGLIKSIAQQHLAAVEQMVMRNVAQGRDLKALTDELEDRFEITRRRAMIIARDQNNKATASIQRVRQKGMGVTEAVWMHSHGGKEPRPSHVAFSGQRYDIEKGAMLDGERCWPGTAINCRCVSKAVLPGFD